MLLPAGAVRGHLVERVERCDLRVDRQAELRQELQRLVMAGELGPADDLPGLVGPERQLATGGDGGVLLAQRPGGRVAGVDEEALAGLLLTAVQLLERRDRHVHLTADLQHLRRAGGQAPRHHGDGGHVGGDVLAHLAVAAGGRLHEPAPLVADAHGQAVDLELADVLRRAAPPRPRATRAPHAVSSPASNALSRLIIGTRWTTGEKVTDAQPWTRCVGESGTTRSGMRLLQRPQLQQQGVVLGVRHLGFVELVVPLVVVRDEGPQLLHPRHRVLGQINRRSHGAGHVMDVSQGVAQGCRPPHAAALVGGPVAIT